MSGASSTTACCQKCAPHDREATRVDDADADEPELGVGAGGHDRCPLGEPGRRRRLGGDGADRRSRLDDLRKHPALEPDEIDHVLGPVAVAELEHARARAERRIGDKDAAQPRQDPVAEHPHVGD
jgi:hypothetical protein